MKLLRSLTLLGLCLGLCACAPAHAPSPQMPELSQAPARWQKFMEQSQRPDAPFRLSGSLRFGPQNDTSRVTYTLWGNAVPLRLDIQAGMGSVVARMQAGDGLVLTLLPGENKAYLMRDTPASAMSLLRLPLPLNMADMTLFLRGNFAQALGEPTWSKAVPQTDNLMEYTVQSPVLSGILTLDEAGLPRAWQSPDGWKLRVENDEAGLPLRLDGSFNEDYRLVLLVKERQTPPLFTAEQVDLTLPADTQLYSLESGNNGVRP